MRIYCFPCEHWSAIVAFKRVVENRVENDGTDCCNTEPNGEGNPAVRAEERQYEEDAGQSSQSHHGVIAGQVW